MLFVVLLLSSAGMNTAWAGQSTRPNIVLIVADDIGYSDFGTYGGEIDTPHIDALAEHGVRFSNFHVAASCAPTRAMLMTGVDSHLAGMGSMRELMPLSHRGKPGYDGVLNDRVQTIATLLGETGYRTAVAGKWHLGNQDRNLPGARGFDQSVIQADSGSDHFEMRPYLPMKPEVFWYENDARMTSLPDDFYSSRYFVDKTIEFLAADANTNAPFFAYLAFQANHTPVQAPAEFIDRYRGRYTEGWAKVRQARIDRLQHLGLLNAKASLASGPTQAEWDALTAEPQYFEARRMQAYAGMATAMDHEIGRLLNYLRNTGQYDNTVIILLSDNGATNSEPYENEYGRRWLEKHYTREVETLGEKGSWVTAGRHWGRVANTPLSGSKFFAGEGGVRAPLIISGLPVPAAQAAYHEFAYVTDIVPTLLDIAGVRDPEPSPDREVLQGNSLLPLLQNKVSTVHDANEAIGYEFSGGSALYRGEFKLIRNRPPAGDGHWRLFKISTDPGETSDLSAQLPELYSAMQADYASYARAAGVLDMPEHYTVAKQVAINTLVFYYLPRYLPYAVVLIGLLVVGFVYARRKKQRNEAP
ncbi:MAG: arylsulfatase [Pseudomonadales bacterium]